MYKMLFKEGGLMLICKICNKSYKKEGQASICCSNVRLEFIEDFDEDHLVIDIKRDGRLFKLSVANTGDRPVTREVIERQLTRAKIFIDRGLV